MLEDKYVTKIRAGGDKIFGWIDKKKKKNENVENACLYYFSITLRINFKHNFGIIEKLFATNWSAV